MTKNTQRRAVVVGADTECGQAVVDGLAADGHVVAGIAGGSPEVLEPTVRQAVASLGGVDVLVHVAPDAPASDFLDLPLATWRATLDGQLDGSVVCAQLASAAMKEQGAEAGPYAILFVTGEDAVSADGTRVAQSAAAAGTRGFMRHLALNLGRDNILVNLLARTAEAAPAQVAETATFLVSAEAANVTGSTITV